MRTCLALFAVVASAIGCSNDQPTALRVAFELDEAAFNQPPRAAMVPFDVVSADMDRDGDPDVLVNWHNLAPIELFENVDGSFVLRNPDADDRSGLFENPGIARLYGAEAEMLAKARRAGRSGVFLWHDPSPRGDWHFYVVPGTDPVTLELRANQRLTPRLDDHFVRGAGELEAALTIDMELHFRAGVELVATRLAVKSSLPIFVGRELTPVGTEVSLWKDDPHGIAWVHVRGTAAPEVFITRGGLGGSLVPPLEPKTDRFFEFVGTDVLFADRRALIPAGYGRGRRTAWVDIDGDGVNELYIGNSGTPNALLAVADVAPGGGDVAGIVPRDAEAAGSAVETAYVDIAVGLGLDARDGDTFAWLDLDADGLDDLVYIDAGGFSIAYNRGDRRFELGRGSDIGLSYPSASRLDAESLFDALSLHVVDFDNDGLLDLWLSGHGEDRGHALYRSTGGAFIDVTVETGLDRAPLTNDMVLLDAENDGYVDALLFGLTAAWLRNRDGRRFELEEVDPGWGLREFTHGAGVDVDGDALLDVVLVGHRRMVARNRTIGAGGALRVLPVAAAGDPVGTVVTARYAGGMLRAQRYGSALSTRYSQGLAPLHFGLDPDEAIEQLTVRWPGGEIQERTVRPGETFVELRRQRR